jgi:hypothetical protein
MFEHRGYFKEYFIDGKSIGTITCEKDREIMGYTGKIKESIIRGLKLDNGKKIKSGAIVESVIYPLCGRLLNNPNNQPIPQSKNQS